jgi:rubrerythrin
MVLNTASTVVGFAKNLEEDSARFYEDLLQRYHQDEDIFLSLIKENRKNAVQIERVYYEVITDAIEGCFAFEMNLNEYSFKTEIPEKASYANALVSAIGMEDKIIRFYSDAAEQRNSLMADVPRAFQMMARRREDRKLVLTSLLDKRA